MMNGIDISSHQGSINLNIVPCDFVIVKATQGTSYINPYLQGRYALAKSLGKKLGVYHYASKGGAVAEADHFIKTARMIGAIGEAILILDWEGEDNANWGNVTYAKAFLDRVKDVTGITPMIYMSKSVCRAYNWNDVAAKYPLWAAQYASKAKTGYKEKPWTDMFSFGPWTGPLIYQYASTGRLNGYANDLDLNITYLSGAEWDALAGAVKSVSYGGVVTASALNVRSGPSTSADILLVGGKDFLLPKGMIIAVEAELGGWGKLASIPGWVSLQYIKR